MAVILYSIVGIARVGATRAGYHSGQLLCQVGKRILPARAGIARVGATRAGLTEFVSHLRNLARKSLTVEDTGLTSVPRATFTIRCALANKPQDGDPVIVAIGTLRNRLFAGHLSNPEEEKVSQNWFDYHCQSEGFARLLRKRVVSGTWEDGYAGAILEDILTTYVPDQFWMRGNVHDGAFIGEITFDFCTLLEACNRLANLSGYVFYVDPLREVHFKPQTKHVAPWAVDNSERFDDLVIREDSSQIKNRIIVRYSTLSEVTEEFLGDGTQKVFRLAEKPHDISSITVNSVAQTFGTRYAEDNSSNDFSVNYDEGTIHTQNRATLTDAETLAVTYQGKVPARLVVNHAASQIDRSTKEGYGGIYEMVITDREIFSQADAQQRAEDELARYAWPLVSATYKRTDRVFAYLQNRLRVGMEQSLTARGRSETLTIEKIVLMVFIPAHDLRFSFKQDVTLGPVDRGLVDIFQDLQQGQAAGSSLNEAETVVTV